MLDAHVLDGELLLVLHGSPAAMFSAKAGIAHLLGCGVHLVAAGMIVRRPDVMGGAPVFRGTRVPPGAVFSNLAEKSATEIVRIDYPSLSRDLVSSALRQACRLLEREAPWVDR
ncbi:DUF433 domain-containing protein [Bradyrhizobium guangdongense]|uniref:DUF433 domain-containing protein n=1 Tax=Bradyrhizobium guangdongense TaxID=1325090 RepID=UPI001319BA7F|nr:DUF433 domain-containing protein [Bradyrhizobium guangdongense]